MKKKQLIRVLLIDEDPVEAEWYIQSLRSTRFALRPYLAKDIQSFVSFLNDQIYDIILFTSTTESFDINNIAQAIEKTGQDSPLIVIRDGKDKSSLIEASNSAIQAGAIAVVEKRNKIHLVHTVFREISWLNDRRELKRNRMSLYRKEEQCRQLSDTSRQPIAYLHHSHFSYVNNEFITQFGISNDSSLDDKTIYDFVSTDDKEAFSEFLNSLDEHSFAPAAVEVDFVNTKGDTFTALVELSPASYHNEDFVQLMLIDDNQNLIQDNNIKSSSGNLDKVTDSHSNSTNSNVPAVADSKQKPEPEQKESVENKIDEENKNTEQTKPPPSLNSSDYFYKAVDQVIETMVIDHLKNTLLCIQNDNLGEVNSTFGVAKAKSILENTASLFSLVISPDDIAARLAEDIYGILLKNTDLNSAMQVAEKIINNQKDSPVEIDGKKVDVSLSIGVVPITGSRITRQELIANAFSACRKAKKSNDKKISVYSSKSENATHLAGTLHLTKEILQAINKNLFKLVFQPIISMKGHHGEYYEVLLRMEDSQGDPVPMETLFIHAAEKKLVTIIDEWVIANALKLLSSHVKKGRNLHFFINISPDSAVDKNIIAVIKKHMTANEITGERLVFEITEGTVANKTTEIMDFINSLKELGCKTTIKHVGSGLKSLEITDLMPVDYIKMDASVINNLKNDKESFGSLKAITNAAHESGKFCIADCLEEQSDMFVLFQNEVDFAQGSYIQEPSEAMDFDFSSTLESTEEMAGR